MKKSHLVAVFILAALLSPIKASTTINRIGAFDSDQSAWKITVKQDESPKFEYKRDNGVGTAVAPSKWRPHLGWFVHIDDDSNLWAFDGIDRLILMQVTEQGSVIYDLHSLHITPPDEVLALLPEAFREVVTTELTKRRKPNKAEQTTPRKLSD